MKKWKLKFKKWKAGQVDISRLDDRVILLNLYFTQLACLLLALILILFQKNNGLSSLLSITDPIQAVLWGAGFALVVLAADMLISRWVPEEVTDDGGINEKMFGRRPLWHILILCFIVAVCEELLFRGALQHWMGPYWTSILFAAIHVRYLQHWLMTGLVFCISYGLGWIFIHTGTLWTPIIAHFLIDLVMGCIIRFKKDAA
ncbi:MULTISPECIES: CPBP family intramembrane glutamic endopeptidase [Paenibacillus]|uniref:CPBP family intramembrane glutamic endopeptidase n=1 Tax=Paenibacillus residui TaxID=629724 RepID=A0ABW3D508_9BACL